METKSVTVEDQAPVSPVSDYTGKLALLFVDICDFIGLPVNIPWGLQSKDEEVIAWG